MTLLRHVRRNREADADVAAGARQDLRVDADQLALRVHQRAAGVAVVDRRVGLQEVLVARRRRPPVDRPFALMIPIVTVCPTPSGLPTASTTSPTWTSSELPSAIGRAGPMRVTLSSARSLGLSVPTSFAVERPAVGQLDVDVVRAVDDVVVGEDVAVGR